MKKFLVSVLSISLAVATLRGVFLTPEIPPITGQEVPSGMADLDQRYIKKDIVYRGLVKILEAVKQDRELE